MHTKIEGWKSLSALGLTRRDAQQDPIAVRATRPRAPPVLPHGGQSPQMTGITACTVVFTKYPEIRDMRRSTLTQLHG